jgi:hypothetical protein
MTDAIRERFAVDTAEHVMTVLHDDGLYRHLQFRAPGSSFYWFELVTVPGALIFQGDGDSYTFRRIEDMFSFFRGPVGRINPGYWSEKLTDGRDRVMQYDREMFEACVRQDVADRDDLPGLAGAVQEAILDNEDYDLDYEEFARLAVQDFTFYVNDADRYDYTKRPDFEFVDSWEWSVRDYHWWFLWALHAIVWGIGQYDASHGRPVLVAPAMAAPERVASTGTTVEEATPTVPARPASKVVTLQAAGERL